MSNHTPGPWAIKHEFNIFGNRKDIGHEGSVATAGGTFSNVVSCHEESVANARLIAAAPTMYELLVAIGDSHLPDDLDTLVMELLDEIKGKH